MTSKLDKIRRSVVKVFTQSDAPDYDQPWQTQGVVSSVGSGLIVSTKRGPRVLTNAHVVENRVFVEVRLYGESRKFVAKVEGVGHECDLALLSVREVGFFRNRAPLRIGDLPMLGERVTVFGYPVGGDRLSITQGVVSRIEMSAYAQSQRRLLSVQIDAAINAGNSGGPVIDDSGRLIGVAFQALDEGENIGYVIGSPVVRHFLKDMETLAFHGFPELGIVTQRLTSSAQRRSFGLPANQQRGALVKNVVYRSSAWGALKRGDVLLKIGTAVVASDRSIRFRRGERIHYSYLVARRHVGEKLTLTFWRSGRIRTCDVELKAPQYLVPEDRYDVKPSYFIYGGLLFVPLSRDYLKTWGDEWGSRAPSSLISIYDNEIRTRSRLEVVILQKVLADQVNQGYHDFESQVVSKVQGKRIRDMRQLVRTLDNTRAKFVRLDLDEGATVILDRLEVASRMAKILSKFGVPRDRSSDYLN
jgi:S1-C subfamily serine protease